MIDKETDVSKDWSDDLSFFSCDSSIEELDHVEPELIYPPSVNPLYHLQSTVACWIITFICSVLMCIDFNRMTLCMSLLQAMFFSMQRLKLTLKMMIEKLGQDGCVDDGFKCYPACLMMLSHVMLIMWFVGLLSDLSMWMITMTSILKPFELMQLPSKIKKKLTNKLFTSTSKKTTIDTCENKANRL